MIHQASTVIIHDASTPSSYWIDLLIVTVGAALIVAILGAAWKLPKWIGDKTRSIVKEELAPIMAQLKIDGNGDVKTTVIDIKSAQRKTDASVVELRADFAHHSHDPAGLVVMRPS